MLSLLLTAFLFAFTAAGSLFLLDAGAAEIEAKWGSSNTYEVGSGTLVQAIAYANTLPAGTAYIQLQNDVNVTSPVTIQQNKNVYLDLNGKKLNRNLLSTPATDGNVITVRGTLTVADNFGGGMITGGNNNSFAGGVYVNEGTFILKSGQIFGNKSKSNGGGIYATANSIVRIEGGSIANNSSEGAGGGIYSLNTVELRGGSIEGNSATNAPGGIYYGAELRVSGSPRVIGNTSSSTSSLQPQSNILVVNKQITIDSPGLQTGALIGLATDTPPTSTISRTFTGYNSADYSGYFKADNIYYTTESLKTSSNYQVILSLHEVIWGSTTSYLDGAGSFSDAQAYLENAAANSTIFMKLQKSVAPASTFTIKSGITVYLDLNGNNIDRKLASATANGNVITLSGNLIIGDTLSIGKITGGKNTGNGGGIYVTADGVLTVNKAIITANTANNGGGIFAEEGSTATLNDCIISNNTASNHGGGLYSSSANTLVTDRVTISGNTATNNGGGIYVNLSGTLNLSGRVTSNSSSMDGGGVFLSGNLVVSGSAYVYGNTKTGVLTTASNIYLPGGKIIVIGLNGLSGDARMGVTTQTTPTVAAPVTLITPVSHNYSGYFTSDNVWYGIKDYVSGGIHELRLCNQSVTIGNLSGSITRRTSVSGLTYTVTTTGVTNGTAAQIVWYNNASKTASGDTYRPYGVTVTAAGSVNNNTLTLNVSANTSTVAGDYYFTVTIDGMESDIKILTIGRTKLSVPIPTGTYYYTGYNQTVTLSGFDSSTMLVVSGNIQKDVGLDYKVVISLRYPDQYEWVTGSTANQVVSWDIFKALVTRPTVVSGGNIYKGADQNAQINNFNSTLMNITGNVRKEVGSYTLTISLKDSSNYQWADNTSGNITLTWEIKKAPLTIKANDVSIVYGDAYSAYTASFAGLVGSDTSASLNGTLKLTCNYTQYSNAGVYNVIPSGLSSPNYEITYQNGSLTVDKKPVTVVWTNTQFTYNGKSHIPSAALRDYGGAGKVSVSGSRTDAGTYTAEAIGFSDINYKLANPTVSFTISPVPLTVTAKDAVAVYGGELTGAGVTYSGFISGENSSVLSGSVGYTFDYEMYDKVGSSYTVTPGGLSSTNYTITYLPGKLTVLKAILAIKINDVTSLKGDEPLTYEVVEGKIYNGDEKFITVLRSEGTAPGRYTISGTMASDDYDVTVINGTYTIMQSDVKASGDTMGILMTAPGGLNPDYKLTVKQADIKTVRKQIESGKVIEAFDITLVNNMISVQPDGSITIRFPSDEYTKYESIAVFHIDKAGKAQALKTTREGGYLVVTVDSLSTFAIVDLNPDYAWIWIVSISVIVVLGGGLCVYLFGFRKKVE